MTAAIIDGKAVAERLRARIASAVLGVAAALGRAPGLAVVLVGENPASQVYVRNKVKQTLEVGMMSWHHLLPADTDRATLLGLVQQLNADPAVDGILVQLPLPNGDDEAFVLDAIDPAKDVDGFHAVNVGRLATGQPALVPCTPLGCLLLLRHAGVALAGANALVVGRSNIVGKPMAQLLLAESATVTIAHSRTKDLAGECRRADVLVAAVGRPRMIQGDWIKPGAVVIDVGINRVPAPDKGPDATRLVGDVDFESAREVAGAITPVPGGVGPMTIACLLRNTLVAACRRAGLAEPELG
jgi:methylenetetrahydrofolate dehydrogenase (NADP+) / methenyltetrahydrofolate cyclohydrolase